jgi:hypothetical protein
MAVAVKRITFCAESPWISEKDDVSEEHIAPSSELKIRPTKKPAEAGGEKGDKCVENQA